MVAASKGVCRPPRQRAEAGVEKGEAPSPTSFGSAFRGKQARVTLLSLGVEQQLGQTAGPAASVIQALFSLPCRSCVQGTSEMIKS